MKKFVIISTVLILLAAGAFGYSLYRYMSVTGIIETNKPEATESAAPDTAADATEAEAQAPADTTAANSIFSENYEKAATYAESMTTEEKVGQLLLGVCDDFSTASAQMQQYALAGMLFESDDLQGMTPEEIASALGKLASGAKAGAILAAVEEGGYYTTVSDLDTFADYDFNSPRSEFATGGLQAVEKAEDEKSTMLKRAGFNLNLAPSVDLASESDQIMYSRSISDNVDTVSAYAEYAAKFDQAKGVSVALKHFPGYGTIPDSANTGTGAVIDERSAATIRGTDYAPFKKGAEAGVHFIMMSNVVVRDIDPVHTAALSPALHSELRSTVGFTGVIMTDLLDGADYSSYSDGNKAAVQAVLAGNDLILVKDYATAYSDILAAVKAGTITEKQLIDACTRVIAYKYTAGLLK